MPLPTRNGIKLVTQFSSLVTRDFDTDLSLKPTATVPVTDGEFFFQRTDSEMKVGRPGNAGAPVAGGATVPGWCSFQERGRYDVQAIAPRGKITVLYMGPYEADFKLWDLNDSGNIDLGLALKVDIASPANLDNLDRGLLTRGAAGGNANGIEAGDIIFGWVTKAPSNAGNAGSVIRVYCPNTFAKF